MQNHAQPKTFVMRKFSKDEQIIGVIALIFAFVGTFMFFFGNISIAIISAAIALAGWIYVEGAFPVFKFLVEFLFHPHKY